MAKHTHIHLHLHPDMFQSQTTADAFEEAKHKREGGKFATQSGASRTPATGANAFAAKHGGTPHGSRESEEAKRQAAYEKSKSEAPLL